MSDMPIHPTAIVDPGAEIDVGTVVGPYCVIGAQTAGSNIMSHSADQ
jgi:acyl-[acyl carrier protein]--UDP-N-acetylglucosamine O-acyltransferase